ncbi:restriction endonuclease subunit S [Campylobacter upsaliensis]|nr:restriction endonuclease subunit S [Campylobacter upsaliensis]
MRVYKPSGIEWLGEIPQHWEVTKFKYFYRSNMGETILTQDLETDGIPVYSATEEDKFFGKIKNPVNILNVNDFVIPARGNSIGAIKIVKEKSTCTQTTIFSKQFKDINPYYVYYFLLGYRKFLFEFIQTAIPQITISQVNENPIILPPLQEQKEIAEFLDSKCEKIQNYIDKKQKLITLLQEKKQALINKVVTKGLNPNIESKNSGIEYLGLIPHHWEVRRMKFMASIHNGREQTEIADENGIYPIYGSGGILGKSMYFIYDKPSVLLGRKGTIDKPLFVEEPFWTIDTMFYTSISKIVLPKYFYYLCLTIDFQFYISGSAIPSMTQYDLANISFALPPLQEQKQIANFLDEKCEKINSAIEKTKRQIELIKEYKNTLINEAVCGRINFLEGILNE